jgi:hypothetical protein
MGCLAHDRQTVATSVKSRSDTFTFDATFDGGSKQADVYDTVGRPVVSEVMRGMNCCIMAYGQTGTGSLPLSSPILRPLLRILVRPCHTLPRAVLQR